jgi:beta-galactosidase/beta-glucuronidase
MDRMLADARAANMNMIRVWGGAPTSTMRSTTAPIAWA